MARSGNNGVRVYQRCAICDYQRSNGGGINGAKLWHVK